MVTAGSGGVSRNNEPTYGLVLFPLSLFQNPSAEWFLGNAVSYAIEWPQ